MIVEGVDKAGKTTVVNLIKDNFRNSMVWKIPRKIVPKSGDLFERQRIYIYYDAMIEFCLNNFKDKINVFDRCYPSEMVYSLVKRKYDGLTEPNLWRLEDKVKKTNHILIYCKCPKKIILNRFKIKGDDYVVKEDIPKLLDRYDEFLKMTELKYVVIDTSKKISEIIKKLKEVIK